MTNARWLVFALGAVGLGVLVFWLAGRYPDALAAEDGKISLVYYVMLLALVASGFLLGRRMGLRFAAKSILLWGLIGLALLLGYAYRFELTGVYDRLVGAVVPHAPTANGEAISVRVSQDGHFRLEARVNGVAMRFLVDTGASDIVLSPADARRVGLDPETLAYTRSFSTANGTGTGAPVKLKIIEIAALRFRNVGASVNGAAMEESLLGMSFLDRFGAWEVRNGTLSLFP